MCAPNPAGGPAAVFLKEFIVYRVSKRIEVAGSHHLDLDYESPCKNLHGHNWIVTVVVEGSTLNQNAMLIDFKHIKQVVNKLDHTNINEVVGHNLPTAENLARWVAERVQAKIDVHFPADKGMDIPKVIEVSVQESEGNIAWFIL